MPPRFIPCKAYAFRPIRSPKHYLPDIAHARRTLSALPAARGLEKVDSASYDWQLSSHERLQPGRSYPGGLATGQTLGDRTAVDRMYGFFSWSRLYRGRPANVGTRFLT